MNELTLWFLGCLAAVGVIAVLALVLSGFKAAVTMNHQLDYDRPLWGPVGAGKTFDAAPVPDFMGWYCDGLSFDQIVAEADDQYASLVGAIAGVNKVIDELENSHAFHAELVVAHQDRQELIDELIFEFGD